MSVHPIVGERKLEALRHALGADVLAALTDPQVVEILANPDGRLVLDRVGSGRADTGRRLEPEARERVVRLIADYVGDPVTRENPRLAGVLPVTGERFQGFLPPVTAGPAFSIRKRPTVIWTLEDYVRDGVMTEAQAELLRGAVRERRNLLISGGTGSGKTTLANALLAEPAFANDRVFLIEDTPELQCSAWISSPRSHAATLSRSASSIWFATPCGCGPIGSWSARCARGQPRWKPSRLGTPATRAVSRRSTPTRRVRPCRG